MIPVDDILEALDLSRAEPGSGFLEALFSRFNARVPFENASKIVRDADVADPDAKPRTPEVFWKDHVELGAGGTCFARVAAFDALLTGLGFRTRRVLGQVRNPNDHAALFVETAAGETIADVGFPLPALVPARAGVVESPIGGLRIEAVADGFAIAFEGGVPEGARALSIRSATAKPETFERLWRETFREGAPFLKEVALRRDLGHRILAFARGEVRVDDLCSRLRVPLLGRRAPALAALFDVDEALLERALAIAGDPSPETEDTILTAYLETDASLDEAWEAIASPGGYRRLLEGVAESEEPRETATGFRIALRPGPGAEGGIEDEVSLDHAGRELVVSRSSASRLQRSVYRAVDREGKTWLERDLILPGAREDFLRNDTLRGRLAGSLAVDLLAWTRLLG